MHSKSVDKGFKLFKGGVISGVDIRGGWCVDRDVGYEVASVD